LVSALLAPAAAETILGATVLTRHGDRTSKHYKGYGLTSLGAQQNFRVGSDFRARYINSSSSERILGISADEVVDSQIFASAPDQKVLLHTITAFLQGLYPPTDNSEDASQMSPLDGYQYVTIHGEESESPDAIWLKGDESCPAALNAFEKFRESEEFEEREEATKEFYESFWDLLKGVYDYEPSHLSYKNAYDIFDLLNTASIHNGSLARKITDEEFLQLRTLADSAEFGANFQPNEAAGAMGAKTFAAAVLNQLEEMVSSNGQKKLSVFAGSYDTFLSWFGLSELTLASKDFHGLPDYASTMTFELFTSEKVRSFPSVDNLRVRFLFRNGSSEDTTLQSYPLFGNEEASMSYNDFVASMKNIAVSSAEEWCNTCQSDLLFCSAYKAAGTTASGSGSKGMSNTIAGVIGAMVALAFVSVMGALAFVFMRRR
ncbi:phosphoglycerate mutase-like protein, partial [Sporormia fimetaria CBS 119925]